MRVSDAIRYLSEYENQNQEIMITWNDTDHLEESNSQVWDEAVRLFDKYGGTVFNQECRDIVSEARSRVEGEGK